MNSFLARPSLKADIFLPRAQETASRRMVCTEVEDLGEATHEEMLAGVRRSSVRLQQRAAEIKARHKHHHC